MKSAISAQEIAHDSQQRAKLCEPRVRAFEEYFISALWWSEQPPPPPNPARAASEFHLPLTLNGRSTALQYFRRM